MPTGCLKVVAFVVVMPFILMLPPAGFALLAAVVFTNYFIQKANRDHKCRN